MISQEVERELANVRHSLEQELTALRLSFEDRSNSSAEAVRVALASNEKRLDGMNEFRAALTDQSARMVTRMEADASTSLISERVEQNRQQFETRLSEITKPKWTLMLSMASIFLVVITGVWALVGLKVEATASPIAVLARQTETVVGANTERIRVVENMAINSTQADSSSRTDRGQLNERLRTLESALASGSAERRAQYSVMSAKLVEIETQFCSSDIVRNLVHANDMRVQSLLWSKVYAGEHMPTDNAFYAHICNRQATSD